MTSAEAHHSNVAGGLFGWLRYGARLLVGATLVVVALAFAWDFPTAPELLTIGLLAYGALLVFYPPAWLIIVPAALPLLDLSYWSGRVFFTEYDFLIMITIGVGLIRRGDLLAGIDKNLAMFALLLGSWNCFVTWNGLQAGGPPGIDSWTGYLSSENALREAKGFFWAFMLLPFLALEQSRKRPVAQLISIGMLLGLLFAIATITWERALFTGLFDFSGKYRVSGFFFGMHTGGAAIDAYLMLATPFALAPFFLWPGLLRLLSAPLLLLALYCIYVTQSRANYPAAAAMASVLAIGGAIFLGKWPRTLRAWLGSGLLAALALLFFVEVLMPGHNIQSRFNTTVKDLKTRIDHWKNIVEILGDRTQPHLVGIGRGSFPRALFWDARERGEPRALLSLVEEEGLRFARINRNSDGGAIYLRQRFQPSRDGLYRLSLRARTASEKGTRMLIEFCERHMLKYKAECSWIAFDLQPSSAGWVEYNKPVDLGSMARKGPWYKRRPLDIAILNRGLRGAIDIDAIQLRTDRGLPRLKNPDFERGQDNWFVSYEDHLDWHVKNVLVHLYLEGGALGLVGFPRHADLSRLAPNQSHL